MNTTHRNTTLLKIWMLSIAFIICVSTALAKGKTYVVAVSVDNQGTLFGVPAANAKSLARFFKDEQGAEVFLLLEKNATYNNIRRVMRNMFGKARKEDAIVFIYSGHGYITTSWAAGGVSTWDKSAGGLGYDEIQAIMKSSKASRKMAFVNACYAGGFTFKKNQNATRPKAKADVMIYCSSYGDKESLTSSNGIDFIYYVTKGLKGEADANGDKKVTARELFNYTNPKLIDCFGIHPLMWGKFRDNMVLSFVK